MDLRVQGGTASTTGARDAGLRRLGRLRRWLVLGSLALAGAIAGFVAQAKPGKSSATATPATRTGGTTYMTTTPAPSGGASHLPTGALPGGGSSGFGGGGSASSQVAP